MGDWTVEADRTLCIGSGTCAFAVPDVFDVDAEGRVVVIGEVDASDERVRGAITDCPVSALRLVMKPG